MNDPLELEPETGNTRHRAARAAAIPRIDAEVSRLRDHRAPRRVRDNIGVPLMGLFSRTRDLIAGNFTDPDNPARMIRAIILEMEEVLVDLRASAARTIADRKEMQRHCRRLERLQADWVEKAQLALSKDREDLARAALIEKKKAAGMVGQLNAEMEVLSDSLGAYEEDIAKLQGRLREARSRQAQIAARLESAENRVKLRTLLANERVDEAMARFEQLERRADEAEGRAEALVDYASRGPTLAERIDGLDGDERVDAELEDMKRALGRGGAGKD